MIQALYNFAIYFYKVALHLASLFNKKAKDRIDGLHKQRLDLPQLMDGITEERILVHCSSQGEHEQSKPIIRWILNNTRYHVLLSFYSPSGFNHYHTQVESRVTKLYLPFDTRYEMHSFLKLTLPKKCIIIKNEWWWNLIQTLHTLNIPSYLVSATFRNDHYFIKNPKKFFSLSINSFTNIFVINTSSQKQISKIYNGNLIVSGDTRLDQVNYAKNQFQSTEQFKILRDKMKNRTIVYGSIWAEDITSIKTIISKFPTFNHLIFPHDLSESNINDINSKISKTSVIQNTLSHTNGISIISTMGHLKKAYSLASLAYIGGGFGTGIHNILEASVYNIPTLFGPKYHKSEEAIHLIKKECAFSFNNQEQLKALLLNLHEESRLKVIETKLKSYFSPRISPTEIICKTIFNQ